MIRPSTPMCNSQAQIQIYADRFPLNHSCVKDNNKEKKTTTASHMKVTVVFR